MQVLLFHILNISHLKSPKMLLNKVSLFYINIELLLYKTINNRHAMYSLSLCYSNWMYKRFCKMVTIVISNLKTIIQILNMEPIRTLKRKIQGCYKGQYNNDRQTDNWRSMAL